MAHGRHRDSCVGMRQAALLVVVACAAAAAADESLYAIEVEDLKSGLPVGMSYYRGQVLLIVNVASQCGCNSAETRTRGAARPFPAGSQASNLMFAPCAVPTDTEFTYAKLNALHDKYASKGLRILGFPCNQFGAQEPGTPSQIYDFAHSSKKVAFDLFRKVDVGGPSAHPLFKWLLGAGGSSCADDNAACPSWADAGECAKNDAYMKETCKLSCKVCEAPEGAGAPIRWNFESFLVTRQGALHTRWATGTDLTAAEQEREIEELLAAKDEV